MEEKFGIGDIVLSKAGRDSGKYFVVVSLDSLFAYISNGKLRKLEKPKKKKIKHLENTGCTYEELTGAQFDFETITNPKLKNAIFKFCSRGF